MFYASANPLFLLLLLSLCPLVQCSPLTIFFTYQSWLNTTDQWFTMYTLCLAPLVTHIAFGLAKIVYITENEPKWIDRLTLFNPISIVWRYHAIAYRRIRSTQWDEADVAASNAAFWDGKRWDGSEYMMIRSREYLTHRPDSTHVGLLSGSSLATIALTLQGIQAVFLIVGTSVAVNNVAWQDGLPGLFAPLGFLGLLRLPAAYWILNDFGYDFKGERQHHLEHTYTTESELEDWNAGARRRLVDSKIVSVSEMEVLDLTVRRRLADPSHWKCIAYRAFWIGTTAALMGFSLYDIFVDIHASQSSTCFLWRLMYGELAIGYLIIHIVYVLRRDHVSTVIPCIHSTWYRAYTILMILTAVIVVVVASIETVQVPDGSYMTWPPLNCTGPDACTPLNKTVLLNYVEHQWVQFLEKQRVNGTWRDL